MRRFWPGTIDWFSFVVSVGPLSNGAPAQKLNWILSSCILFERQLALICLFLCFRAVCLCVSHEMASALRNGVAMLAFWTSCTSAEPLPFFSALIMADWGGHGTAPFTTPGELMTASGMAALVKDRRPAFVLALGDNFYADGLCNNATLAPYNATCPTRFDPLSGTVDDPRFEDTFESVFSDPDLVSLPFAVIAGNQDALGNVSASIAYSSRSPRWRHPDYYFRVTTQAPALTRPGVVEHFPHALPGNTSLDSESASAASALS